MGCRSNIRAYFVILGGILVHLSLGTIYTMGNMIPYMVSYIRVHNNSPQLRNTGAIWVQSAALTGQAVGMTISGILQLKFSTRITTVIGGCVMSSGVAVSYFTIRQSFWLLLFTYGFLFGVGLGIAYTPAFACAMKWLPSKKGLVTGLVMIGFGAGAFVFNQIQTVFINPNNEIPDEAFSPGSNEKYFTKPEVLNRVPTCFLLLAGCYAGLQVLGVMLLADPPEARGMLEIYPDEKDLNINAQNTERPEVLNSGRGQVNQSFAMEKISTFANTDVHLEKLERNIDLSSYYKKEQVLETTDAVSDTESINNENNSGLKQKEYSVLEMIKTRNFWILYVTLLLNGQGTILISSMYKAFGQTFVEDDHLLAFVGSFSALFNSSGRPVWGLLADCLSYKVAMMFLCSCMCVLLFTMELTQIGGEVMFFVWICAFYFSLCGNYSMMPAVVSRTFGSQRVGINYSVIFTSQIITSFVSALLASQLKDAIGWFGLFQVTGFLIFLSLILTSIFNGRNPDGTPV